MPLAPPRFCAFPPFHDLLCIDVAGPQALAGLVDDADLADLGAEGAGAGAGEMRAASV